jgi:predicted DNA-binding transcriptional regulator AlpA
VIPFTALTFSAVTTNEDQSMEIQSRAGALKTPEAAAYLGISSSMLRSLRLRGPDDPGRPGPEFARLSANCVVYRIADLDAWLESRKGTLITREVA